MRVVTDTNIFISALVFGGKPERFLRSAEADTFQLIVSEEILLEIADVLSRKFHHNADQIAPKLARIRAASEMVYPRLTVADCSDPDDNRILEAAIEGHADVIVSGDKHLLDMNPFRGIEICNVANLLLRLDRLSVEP
jgi:putative PIN family toxin of toxin-antitoxin system